MRRALRIRIGWVLAVLGALAPVASFAAPGQAQPSQSCGPGSKCKVKTLEASSGVTAGRATIKSDTFPLISLVPKTVGGSAPAGLVSVSSHDSVANRYKLHIGQQTETGYISNAGGATAGAFLWSGTDAGGPANALSLFVGAHPHDGVNGADPTKMTMFDAASPWGVSIGTSSVGAKLLVRGIGTTNATKSLLVENSAGTDLLSVADDGTMLFQAHVLPLNDATQNIGSTSAKLLTAHVAWLKYATSVVRTDYSTVGTRHSGEETDGATAVAHKFGNSNALTTDGALAAGFYSDNFTTLAAKISAEGGIRSNAGNIARPTCSVTFRGQVWFAESGLGVKDDFAVCAKDAADAYAWRTLY